MLRTFRPSPSSSTSSSSTSSPIGVPPLVQLSTNVTPASPFGSFDGTCTTITISSTSYQSLLTEKPTTCEATDKYYTRVLEAFLDQSKSVEDAYAENEAEKRGISWRDLLDRNMDIHPLSDDPTKNPPDDAVDRSTVVPRLHYLPILLECAKVWRHALEEAIDQRGKRTSNEKEWFWEYKSTSEKFQAQDLLHPAERRHLAQQAGRLVQRYLCLLEVLPSAKSIAESNGVGVSYVLFRVIQYKSMIYQYMYSLRKNSNAIVPYIKIRFLFAHIFIFQGIFQRRFFQAECRRVGPFLGLCLRRIPSPRLRDGLGGSHPRGYYRFFPGRAYSQSTRQGTSLHSQPTDAGHRGASYHHRSGGTQAAALRRL